MRGPILGSSDSQALKAVCMRDVFGSSRARLPGGNVPFPVGSGKSETPFLRIHAAKAAIPFAASARCAGVRAGGPPPGRYLRQACIAAWNCGEPGSTFPPNVTPGRCRERPDVVGVPPTEAEKPWAVKHAASAEAPADVDVGVEAPGVEEEVPLGVVVPRLATAGAFALPPHPAASKQREARAAVRRETSPAGVPRFTPTGKPTALKWR